jgi:hypothetical protein
MYLLPLFAMGHLGLAVLQLALVKRADLRPLLWSTTGATMLIGLLGFVMGQILTYSALAHASAEMKETMAAAGTSVSLFTVAGALMVVVVQVGINGVVSSLVATLQRPAVPAQGAPRAEGGQTP